MYNPNMENKDLPPKLPGGKLISDESLTHPSALKLIEDLMLEGTIIHPRMALTFENRTLYSALTTTGKNDEELKEIIRNTVAFDNLIRNPNLFAGPITIDDPTSQHSNGTRRRPETGLRINFDFLHEHEIDSSKVLFFRVTQPSPTPKPEYYWTSDYFETMRGLTAEIPQHQRQTSIILVADIITISGEKGLMSDINDDQGLSVRQISLEPFDQSQALAVIPTSSINN